MLLVLITFVGMLSVQGCVPEDGTASFTVGAESVRRMAERRDAQLTPQERHFLSIPSNVSARESLKFLTSEAHVAGTEGDHKMALYVQQSLLRAGLPEVKIDPQRVLLSYPVDRSLQLLNANGQVLASASLSEEVLAQDRTSDTWWRNHTFHGYSPSGNATARVVYANFGFPEDFAELEAKGVDVKGAIVLMRYGKCFRGLKAMNAQKAGAIAALIYSDPEQDGYAVGSVYPHGPWRPQTSVQRGSIQFISICAGDPSRAYRPNNKTVEEVCGHSQQELIPSIPVLPISWGDAVIFLDSMGGPKAPSGFQGGLNMTYRTGPTEDGRHAVLRIHNRFVNTNVWNVIATIPGSLPPSEDQPIVLGNHRDAWVFGAADPNSGTSQMLEVGRGLGSLLRTGWRPLRTVVMCSWSGEEYGLLGSTAWAEVNADETLLKRAAAYINVDTGVSGTLFRASGTPSLARVLAGVLGQVEDPATGQPLSVQWNDGDLSVLGSGSDYTAFIDHLGIPSLDMAFIPKALAPYGVYHSTYDSFDWMQNEGDPHFLYHCAMAKVWGLVAMRLAGSSTSDRLPLPFNFSLQAEAITGYINDAKAEPKVSSLVDFTELEASAAAFTRAAHSVDLLEESIMTRSMSADRTKRIAELDEMSGALERQFLSPAGLPGRYWFKHVLQAPGLYTGYAPKTLPGIDDAIQPGGNPKQAALQAKAAADRIAAAAAWLERAL